MLYKIIKNSNEEYAIRWGIWPFYSYLDLRADEFWWSRTFYINQYCFTNSKELILFNWEKLFSVTNVNSVPIETIIKELQEENKTKE